MSAAHADAFYREVLRDGAVWAVRDDAGFPAPLTRTGQQAQPFWSARSRAQKVIDTVPVYAALRVVEIPLDVWRDRWLVGLEKDELLVGLNWSGRGATGYDVSRADVARNLTPQA